MNTFVTIMFLLNVFKKGKRSLVWRRCTPVENTHICREMCVLVPSNQNPIINIHVHTYTERMSLAHVVTSYGKVTNHVICIESYTHIYIYIYIYRKWIHITNSASSHSKCIECTLPFHRNAIYRTVYLLTVGKHTYTDSSRCKIQNKIKETVQ